MLGLRGKRGDFVVLFVVFFILIFIHSKLVLSENDVVHNITVFIDREIPFFTSGPVLDDSYAFPDNEIDLFPGISLRPIFLLPGNCVDFHMKKQSASLQPIRLSQ